MKIKSTKHSTKFINMGKKKIFDKFLNEYRMALSFYLEYLWYNPYIFNNHILDIQQDIFNFPSFINVTNIKPKVTSLSSRALSCAANQILGIIRASCSKRSKQLFVKNKLLNENKLNEVKILLPHIKPLIKPVLKNNSPVELGDKCVTIIKSKSGLFDYFLKIYAIGNSFGRIYIPIKATSQSNKYLPSWNLRKGVQLNNNYIDLRWQKDIILKNIGEVIGADQGRITCVSLSDGQTTSKDIHNHDLESILQKLSKKKSGSKSFKRTQEHRKNYINWSVKQLNLTNIKEIRLEKLNRLQFKSGTSKATQLFSYLQIKIAMENHCFTNGVHFVEQPSIYRSQRCNICGLVRKSNRKGKIYSCKNCGLIIDSDLNAAKNHALNLPTIPFEMRRLNLNKNGFFWKEIGLFDLLGQELIVPDIYNL